MTSELLPVLAQEALVENQHLLPSLLTGRVGLRDILTFCQNFRMAGTGALLLTGRAERFHWHLHQSGRAFAWFLANSKDSLQRTSRALPFFDAVVAGDLECAAEVARRARHTWARGEEYEEDFLFIEFLMRHFFLQAAPDETEALLQRYAQALQGTEDPRLGVCQSLLEKDARLFDESLNHFLSEQHDRFEQVADRTSLPEDVLATERYVSVEGLALVCLAESQGMATAEDYLHVPSIARERTALVFSADSWKAPVEDLRVPAGS